MKFSVFTVITPEFGIEETVKLLKTTGYDGVEWRVGNAPPKEKPTDYTYERRYWSYNVSTLDLNSIIDIAPTVRDVCKKYAIETCMLTPYLDLWETKKLETILQAANIIGCKNIRVTTPKYDEKEYYPQLFNRCREQVSIIEKMAAEYGVRMLFHIHHGNIISSASAAYRFISGYNPDYVGVIYDPGNMVYEGFENYRMGIELLGKYIGHVHIKNVDYTLLEKNADESELRKGDWSITKRGGADFKKCIVALKDNGYAGYLSISDFSNEEDTPKKLITNLDFLKTISNKYHNDKYFS